jgi:hypothetical protein
MSCTLAFTIYYMQELMNSVVFCNLTAENLYVWSGFKQMECEVNQSTIDNCVNSVIMLM